MRKLYLSFILISILNLAYAYGDDSISPENSIFELHGESALIYQNKPSFHAPYGIYGDNMHSLSPNAERGTYSLSITPSLGLRIWDGGELHVDPQVFSTKAISGMVGLGGLPNGEDQRGGGVNPKLYLAKMFLRQTWNFDGNDIIQESDIDQMAQKVSDHRLVLTLGKISVADIFDGNEYSHNPKTQFMNWSLMSGGAYDYAADLRGYTTGLALEYYLQNWTARFGRFMEPNEPNGSVMDKHLFRHYGDQIEIEHSHNINGKEGKIRALVFRNKTGMGSYRDALALANQTLTIPDETLVRKEHAKVGYVIGLEQQVSDNIGVFGRYSWCDGKTEMYSFAEIDHSVSGGLSIKGTGWGRQHDTLGIAVAINGLSDIHKKYLSQGGLDFLIGDGQLNYQNEIVSEAYYSSKLTNNIWGSLDFQHIENPAYNTDRGPVNIYGLRVYIKV